jgi:hypothetical protein
MTDELELDLRRVLRAEAFRPPVHLTGQTLRARLEADDRRRARRPWNAALAGVAAIAVLVGVVISSTPIVRFPGGEPTPSAACAESPATKHGSWWVEMGGPNAFFNIEPGTRTSIADGAWLLFVRFDPDADPGALSLTAEELGSGERVTGSLNSSVDPSNIFRFDQPAPSLTGGWYLFELPIASPGCWRIDALVGDELTGTATVNVMWGRPAATVDPSAPEPTAAAPTPTEGDIGTGAIIERYPDGLPSRMGNSPVFRGLDAIEFAAGRTHTTPFLVTGWVTYWGGPFSCPFQPAGEPPPWSRDCDRARFADLAGGLGGAIADAITFRYVLNAVQTGPVVAVVHVRDPRATECGADAPFCAAMMVVDRIVWAGDSATAPGPLDADEVGRVLETVQGSTDLEPLGDGPILDCGELLPAAEAYTVNSGRLMTPGVTLVQLEPTVDALHRAKDLPPGVEAALGDRSVSCTILSHAGPSSSTTYRWLLIENAALLVRTSSTPTAKDRAFLERLEALLHEAVIN